MPSRAVLYSTLAPDRSTHPARFRALAYPRHRAENRRRRCGAHHQPSEAASCSEAITLSTHCVPRNGRYIAPVRGEIRPGGLSSRSAAVRRAMAYSDATAASRGIFTPGLEKYSLTPSHQIGFRRRRPGETEHQIPPPWRTAGKGAAAASVRRDGVIAAAALKVIPTADNIVICR